MTRLPPGLYQTLITEALAHELRALGEDQAQTAALHPAEAADRLPPVSYTHLTLPTTFRPYI